MNQRVRSPAIFYLVFFFTGTATVMLGVLLARAPAKGFADAALGALLATQFYGQVVGSLALTRRTTLSLAIGLALLTVACGGIAWVGGPAQGLLFVLGMGLGLSMSATNVIVGEEAGERRGSALELLNVFWPIGAAVCAPLVGLVANYANPWRCFALPAVVFAGALVWLCVSRSLGAARAGEATLAETIVPWSRIAMLCCVALLAIGVETGIASWLPTFATRVGATPALVTIATACFWSGCVLSRLCASLVLRRVTVHRLAASAALGAIVFSICLAAIPYPAVLCVTALLTAFCLGPLYPAILSDCVKLRGRNFIFVSAGLGAALMPWAIGQASNLFGSLNRAMLVAPAGAILLLLLMSQAGITRRDS